MNKSVQRRSLLKWGAASAVGLSPLGMAAQSCLSSTPQQVEGPFYPIKDQFDKDWDLVAVRGRNQIAKGEIIYIQGQVLDSACKPIVGAIVEIWQACATGKYNHPNDPNTAPLDPNFQYWGRAVTNAQGVYMFRTIKPGAYPADAQWWRPPHIHYKVHKLGFLELTTQLYFAGDPLNLKDKILQRLPKQEQAKVVCPIQVLKTGHKVAVFNLTLEKA